MNNYLPCLPHNRYRCQDCYPEVTTDTTGLLPVSQSPQGPVGEQKVERQKDLGIPEADVSAGNATRQNAHEHRFASWYEAHGKYLGIGRASCHIIYAAAIKPFKDAKEPTRAEIIEKDFEIMESLRNRILMLAPCAEHCSVFAYCVRDVARKTGDYETALFNVLGKVMEATSVKG